MKKNYNVPEMKVVSLEAMDVLTISAPTDEILVNADRIFGTNRE